MRVLSKNLGIVGDARFSASLRGYAWQAVDELEAVDGTIELELRAPGIRRTALAIIHGRMERRSPTRPFTIPLALEQISELTANALAEESDTSQPRLRLPGGRRLLTDCRIPVTQAPQHAGRARAVLEARFGLGSTPDMQDWPLEVCDPSRVAEFCAFYDEVTDPLVRFDTMQLALFSYDESQHKSAERTEWFRTTLQRDFALHGHTVSRWAALEREANDPELQRADSQFVFSISGLLRQVRESSLVPLQVVPV